MTLDQLLSIKKCSEVTGLDINILGASVFHNLMYVSVRPAHIQSFKVFLYAKVKGLLLDIQASEGKSYQEKINYMGTVIPLDNPWNNLVTSKPTSEAELARIGKVVERVTEGDNLEAYGAEKMVSESTPSEVPNSLIKKLYQKVKGLF